MSVSMARNLVKSNFSVRVDRVMWSAFYLRGIYVIVVLRNLRYRFEKPVLSSQSKKNRKVIAWVAGVTCKLPEKLRVFVLSLTKSCRAVFQRLLD